MRSGTTVRSGTLRLAGRRLRAARYWCRAGDVAEAARHARRALRLVRRHPAPPLDLAVEVARAAARVERALSRVDAARDILAWALGMLDGTPESPRRDRLLAAVLHDLGDCHRRTGRRAEAVRSSGRSGRLARLGGSARGDASALPAATLALLGMAAKQRGDFESAARYYAEAGEIHERSGATPGEAATLQHHLAGLAHAGERFADAETHARRAVELRRRVPGATPVDVAPDLAVLAAALAGQHRYQEARALLTLAMTACRTARPPGASRGSSFRSAPYRFGAL